VDDTTQAFVCFSARAREFFTKNYTTINKIAARIASAYSSLADDLIQEGLIALYTDLERKLDRGFDPGREEWRGYVKVVLRRAISRAAKKLIKGDEFLGQPALWQDEPYSRSDDNQASNSIDSLADPTGSTEADRRMVEREETRENLARRVTRMRRLRARLTPNERSILELRLNPPADLVVMSRNLNGDDGSRRGAAVGEITADDIAQYTGTPRAEVRRLIRTARVKYADLRAS
jgi:RNA polymerase sigma factor (sigma-70 family)